MGGRERGFTLIEAVLVLVLLGVLSVGLAAFINNATDHYADTAERTRLLGEARLALGRVGREIQGALPYSMRRGETGDTACVEFLPLVDGGRYERTSGSYPDGTPRHPLPVGGTREGQFHALGFTAAGSDVTELNDNEAEYVAVYPAPPAEDYIYGAGSDPGASADVSLRRLGGIESAPPQGVVEVRLSKDTRFPRHAPEPYRFFLTEGPVSFCLEGGGDLNRYAGYTLASSQPVPPDGEGRPLARNLGTGSVLELEPAGLQRRGLLRLRLVLQRRDDKNEPVEIEHAFAVRNSP
ncbi:MAG: prepilin-type N-terminal cleavage/methylation domain-containing protein [Pseudomonadota bacterium]